VLAHIFWLRLCRAVLSMKALIPKLDITISSPVQRSIDSPPRQNFSPSINLVGEGTVKPCSALPLTDHPYNKRRIRTS